MNTGMGVRSGLARSSRVFSVAGPEPMAGEEKGNGLKSELEKINWVQTVQDRESHMKSFAFPINRL